ncbi:uncharacterized protein LOC6577222 isoform X3 [Drosophila mojavensis]|uniref:Uncharacterized protein, isoform B n=1 Tax=Drosophila mojavensis TaxID=7230 RepID=A0A0Q9X7U1_DROMO|nr:uncharacterized protein LOC6577222 isoform X3 [Drosophila mojavensis]KRG03337.1 uncharacterized protein Dmoj_GI23799, isoform B [Drosophila mojavensis]
MQSNKMDTKSETKQDILSKSNPNHYESDGEGESSLNPYALEFIPSYLKCGKNDNSKRSSGQKTKTEATSTTTLVQREVVGDASYLQAQRQLFELLHQMGDKFMPLKAINVSLAADGQGINVLFKADISGVTGKQMLDENLCQDAALHLDVSDCSLIPRRLPNVLAANFMVRMGDVLNDKMEWNEDSMGSGRPTIALQPIDEKYLDVKSSMSSKHSIESKLSVESKRKSSSNATIRDTNVVQQLVGSTASKESMSKNPKQQLPEPVPINGTLLTFDKPYIASKAHMSAPSENWKNIKMSSAKAETRAKTMHAKQEPKFEKKSNKGIHTPRQSLGQIIKKGLTSGQKFVPRSTHTSLMRQTQVQKRLSLMKATDN